MVSRPQLFTKVTYTFNRQGQLLLSDLINCTHIRSTSYLTINKYFRVTIQSILKRYYSLG